MGGINFRSMAQHPGLITCNQVYIPEHGFNISDLTHAMKIIQSKNILL